MLAAYIVLKPVAGGYAAEILNLLNNDQPLRNKLGMPEAEPMCLSYFLNHNKKWCAERNAIMYAIVLESCGAKTAIGTITLSHADKSSNTASVGYAIGSSYWNRGYTTQAFRLVIDHAKDLGITTLTCSIRKDTPESKRIWEKFGANVYDVGNKWRAKLHI